MARTILVGTTVSGNTASNVGGGLWNEGGLLEMSNSTISGNVAQSRNNPGGGGLWSSGSTELTHVTVTLNRATSSGDGIHQVDSGASSQVEARLLLRNSIVAGNGGNRPDDLSGKASLIRGRGNLVGTGGDGLGESNLVGIANPGLGPLADNGGPTLTHAPLTGSAAIDAALASLALEIDQRGVARPGRLSDIGAVEYVPPAPDAVPSAN
jgi:hypothetical protein